MLCFVVLKNFHVFSEFFTRPSSWEPLSLPERQRDSSSGSPQGRLRLYKSADHPSRFLLCTATHTVFVWA